MSERMRKYSKSASLLTLNYHCRLHCLEYVKFEYSFGQILVYLEEKGKGMKYRGVFGRNHPKFVTPSSLFRMLYGFFSEDRTRTIFLIDRSFEQLIVHSIDPQEGEEVQSTFPLRVVKYAAFGNPCVQFNLEHDDVPEEFSLEVDLSECERFRNWKIKNFPSINFIVGELKKKKAKFDYFAHGYSWRRLGSIDKSNLHYLCANTAFLNLEIGSISEDCSPEHTPTSPPFSSSTRCRTLILRSRKRNLSSFLPFIPHNLRINLVNQLFPSRTTFKSCLQNLRRLEIFNHTIRTTLEIDECFRIIRDECLYLRKLRFFFLKDNIPSDNFTEPGPLFILLNGNETLEELDIEADKSIVSSQVGKISNNTLEKLHLLVNVENDGDNNNNNNNQGNHPAHYHILRALGLHRPEEEDPENLRSFEISSEFLITLISRCEQLHEIELKSGEQGKLSGDISTIINTLPSKITSLKLIFPRIKFESNDNANIIENISKLKNLRTLHISSRNQVYTAIQIFSKLKNLEELMIKNPTSEQFPNRIFSFSNSSIYDHMHKIKISHLRRFEENFGHSLKRFAFNGVCDPFMYYLQYSGKFGSLQYASNYNKYNDRGGFYDKDGDQLLKNCSKSRSNEEFRTRKKEIMRSRRRKVLMKKHGSQKRLPKKTLEEKIPQEITDSEQEEYLQKSISKWGLLPPYEKDKTLIRWKDYYEERCEMDKVQEKPHVPDYLDDDDDYNVDEYIRSIKNGVEEILKNSDPGSFKEEEKKLICRSLYFKLINVSYPNDNIITVFYSIYGDGQKYRFEVRRRYKDRTLFNEYFEHMNIVNQCLWSRDLESNSNFVNYEVMKLKDLKFMIFCLFGRVHDEVVTESKRRYGDFFRLFCSFCGSSTFNGYDSGNEVMEAGFDWVEQEATRVWNFEEGYVNVTMKKKTQGNEEGEEEEVDSGSRTWFKGVLDEEIEELSECIIDDSIGVHGHGQTSIF